MKRAHTKKFLRPGKVHSSAMLCALALMLGCNMVSAETVFFNDADREPSNVLQMDGVTVTHTGTGYQPAIGQPTTVLGVGLGLDETIGPMGEANEQVHWPAGSPFYDVAAGGDGLSFCVNGAINSITIMPVLRIFSGTGELMPVPDDLNLEFMSSQYLTGGGFPILPANTTIPVTLWALEGMPGSGSSTCYVTPQPNWSPDIWFENYRSDHLTEEQTLQWGFSVISLDYTPAGIPEPNSVALFLAGLLGVFGMCRRWPLRFNLHTPRKRKRS
jgi:hypothetical protein